MKNWLLATSLFVIIGMNACSGSRKGVESKQSKTSVNQPSSDSNSTSIIDSLHYKRIEHGSQDQVKLDSIKKAKTKSGNNNIEY